MFQTCNLWSQIALLKVEEGSQIDSKAFVLRLHHTFESNNGTWKEDYQKNDTLCRGPNLFFLWH